VQLTRQILLEAYKIVNKIWARYLYKIFNFREMSFDLRNSHIIIPFKYTTMRLGRKSIRFVGVKLLNMLTNELRETLYFNAFKRFVMIQ